jgi:chromate transporter
MLALGLALHPGHILFREGLFFSQAAVVTFGGAYAVLAWVAQQAVENFGWLRPGQMVDGLALAETTPGPLILVLEFVGFLAAARQPGAWHPLLAGTLGAAVALWATFAPCFLWIFAGAPWVESLRGNRRLSSALRGITAAVVGVIANLSVWFGIHVIFREVADAHWGWLSLPLPRVSSLAPGAAMLALAAAVATLRFHLGLGWTLGGCALLGVALHAAGG